MDIENDHKVLLVGWDGATFDLIQPWVDQGLMPNLAQLMAMGSSRRLRSVIPTLSPPAWTTFITGKNPGRHGTFDFLRRGATNYELQSDWNDLPTLGTLFNWVSRSGRKVGIMNVPFTFPPEPVNGFMISGLGGAREWEFVYPPVLKEEILAQGYRIDNPVIYEEGHDDEYLAAALETTRIRAQVALKLMQRQPWDLFMVVFMNIDQILSFMWHHMDESHPRWDAAVSPRYKKTVLELHQYLDTILGEMMAIAGDKATVVVASDHGMGPLYNEVFLNVWLEQKGYLVRKRPTLVRRAYYRLARKAGFSRQNIWRRIGRARTQAAKRMMPKRLHALVPEEHSGLTDVVDWSKSRAYSFGNVGQIFINLAGREPQGIVQPGLQYEEVVNQLIHDLKTFTDPADGQPVVDHIYRREELYDGPHFDRAPDINVVMRDYGYITQARREFAQDEVIRPSGNMSGFHRREGIFVMKGKQVKTAVLPPADIIQVTPTILYDFGLPLADDMDGQPMLDLFSENYVKQNAVQYTPAINATAAEHELTAEQQNALHKQLESLGYLHK
jgi:predicted AlkP superfamily phosphohydrolase/phosphomutase